jgi:hypothetical protein
MVPRSRVWAKAQNPEGKGKNPIPNRVVAKGVQLRLLRQRVVMTAQKAQADVLLHRLHYALPSWDAAAERCGTQDELHSAAQARAWADVATSSVRTTALLSTAWVARLILEPGVRPQRGGGGGCARALAVYRYKERGGRGASSRRLWKNGPPASRV